MTYVILISGRQGAGKTTLANALEKALNDKHETVIRMKFAEPLYMFHDAIRKILQTAGYDNMPADRIDGPLLQMLGTEWGRNTRGQDFWANIAKARVNKLWQMHMMEGRSPYFIFDDCRFPNEVDCFKEYKTLKIRLEAPEEIRKARAEKWRDKTDHPSEVSLDFYFQWDIMLLTNQTPVDVCVGWILENFYGNG